MEESGEITENVLFIQQDFSISMFKRIGATKVARSSEISDRGHFVANFVYFFHIFSKKYLNIF